MKTIILILTLAIVACGADDERHRDPCSKTSNLQQVQSCQAWIAAPVPAALEPLGCIPHGVLCVAVKTFHLEREYDVDCGLCEVICERQGEWPNDPQECRYWEDGPPPGGWESAVKVILDAAQAAIAGKSWDPGSEELNRLLPDPQWRQAVRRGVSSKFGCPACAQ